MSPEMILEGKCHVIRAEDGRRIDDIDTDMIFHNAHLHITDPAEMAPHAFGNLPGWENFPQECSPGDILVVGRNFGCGSSRQQAVDCFTALGIRAIIGESFGAIYKRNALNSGWPLIEAPEIFASGIRSGQTIKINLENSTVENVTAGKKIENVRPFSSVQKDIYLSGSLFALGKK